MMMMVVLIVMTMMMMMMMMIRSSLMTDCVSLRICNRMEKLNPRDT